MAAGSGRVQVSFKVDADGLLSVSAREMTTGVQADVTIKPSYGLTDAEVEQMLRDSIDYAEEDMHARMLAEQRVDADRTIEALVSALEADGEAFLDEEERDRLTAAIDSLRTLREGHDADAIKQSVEALNALSEPFAARRMNAGIHSALAGHNINEFGE